MHACIFPCGIWAAPPEMETRRVYSGGDRRRPQVSRREVRPVIVMAVGECRRDSLSSMVMGADPCLSVLDELILT